MSSPGTASSPACAWRSAFDVRGLSYHWLQFKRAAEEVDDPDCDINLLRSGHITITPLRADRHAEGDWQGFQAEFGDTLAVAPLPSLG